VRNALTFRLTRNIFLLWPVFRPMGQLVTLLKENLPLMAFSCFLDNLQSAGTLSAGPAVLAGPQSKCAVAWQ